ncbi:MAG: phosphoenolpyruvate synthase [Candidatus Altiarchaeota archaeon]
MAARNEKYILWFDELGIRDVPLVGGKNASLGEMYRKLTGKGVNVPNGFAITAAAYQHIIKSSGIGSELEKTLKGVDTGNVEDLMRRGEKTRELILQAEIPEDLKQEISAAYKKLCRQYGKNTDVAVRSSATAEDLPDASFAGQQETYLNIHGEYHLIEACKKCFASLFTNRAISYRVDKGFDHFKVYLSIGVQKMVRSDLACSGVMFSIDTESGFKDVVFLTGAWGLGENVVQGAVNPDEYYIHKPTLKKGYKSLIAKTVGAKKLKMVYSADGSKHPTKNVRVPEPERKKFVLTEPEILTLAKWAVTIEDHYKKPMDIEWAKDGRSKKLFIVQARPETVHSQEKKNVLRQYSLKRKGKIIVTGDAVGEMIGQGPANVIKDVHDIERFRKGQVLVTEMTDPDWEPIMKIASAIVTNRGGRTCHAAIVSRELGIPCVIGSENGTHVIKSGQKVTVSCAEGAKGHVFDGILPFEVKSINIAKLPVTKTKIMMNVGIPENAFEQAHIPNDGVGLAREEFIINSYIQIHPMALLDYAKIGKNPGNREVIEKIDELTYGYSNKTQFFIDRLAQGIARIGAAFYPKDVIVRLSDFKSNEYANLIGGRLYEPVESNPMIGWRGASRYYDDNYRRAFALECKAFLKVRGEMGLTNVKVMVPFCRTPTEGRKVVAEMKKNGLVQGKNGLEVYVMCEIPSNVVCADEFSQIFDGFSIGTNDLTQLTLGLDRDSELVAHIYDERETAVKRMVASVIASARKYKRKIGICGQAPSDFPEFAEFLVECGINSMSLNPDTVLKTRLLVAKKEKALKRKKR